MPTQKTLREIIEWLIGEIDKREHMFVRRSDKDIESAISEIKSLLKEKLPKKKSSIDLVEMTTSKYEIERKIANDVDSVRTGYNMCLTEIEKILEVL